MAGISVNTAAFAHDDAPAIKGHEQPRNWPMLDLQHAADTSGLAISFPSQPPNTVKPQRSETASFNDNRPCTPHRQSFARPANFTNSSEPRSLADTPRAPRARQGSRGTLESTPNYTTSWTARSTPDLSSPSQGSTWSHYTGRLRNISGLQISAIYTTPARACATRESSPATSLRSVTSSATGSATLSFITSKMAALKTIASPFFTGNGCGNDLIDLDIEATLFPNGAPQDGEAISHADYKSLQINALQLLHRFQATYKSQTIEFRTLKAEKEALEDEKCEAETRARHAKLQLDEVASKAAERGTVMQAYIDELRHENRALVQDVRSPMIMSEDLGVEEDQAKKMWRRSGDTFKTEVSSDTDEESVAENSIFSRPRSPTMATTISEIGPHGPMPRGRASVSGASIHTVTSQKPQQMTAFRKLIKGISGEADVRTVAECSNCHGQDASIAWDTASLMRDENRGLKMRVTELESALDGALDVVNGLEL
ncbi:hypothetical protein MY11210_005282 [Beauveria gryllotalpidicola]